MAARSKTNTWKDKTPQNDVTYHISLCEKLPPLLTLVTAGLYLFLFTGFFFSPPSLPVPTALNNNNQNFRAISGNWSCGRSISCRVKCTRQCIFEGRVEEGDTCYPSAPWKARPAAAISRCSQLVDGQMVYGAGPSVSSSGH